VPRLRIATRGSPLALAQAELVAAAPNHPVYLQLAYGWAMLTPLALKALNITSDADLPKGNMRERSADGRLTGAISGNLVELFEPAPERPR